MCGFYAWFGAELENSRMVDIFNRLSSRGKNSLGLWTKAGYRYNYDHEIKDLIDETTNNSPEGLAFVRLSTTDDSTKASQPMRDSLGRVFCLNGSIYNHLDLRAPLLNKNILFKTSSDTETIMHALTFHGEKILSECNGGFSFIQWDPIKKSIIAGRDFYGKKQLFYYHDKKNNAFFITSELGSFWRSGVLLPTFDTSMLINYLYFRLNAAGERTLYESIKAVPPGCTIQWDAVSNKININCFEKHSLDLINKVDNPSEILEALLTTSIQQRVGSTKKQVGLFLSGGVDSMAIFRGLIHLTHYDTPVFTATNNLPMYSEQENVARYLQSIGYQNYHMINTQELICNDSIEHFLKQHDFPVLNFGAINQFLLCREVRNYGIDIMMSGNGADELFLGYDWYLLPLALMFYHNKNIDLAFKMIQTYCLKKKTVTPIPEKSKYHIIHFLKQHLENSPDFYPYSWVKDYSTLKMKSLRAIQKYWPSIQLFDLFESRLPQHLRDEDRNSMAFSIETRAPFLDKNIARWALTLSPEVLMQEGGFKWIVNSVFNKKRQHIISNNKIGFYLPFPELKSYLATQKEFILENIAKLTSIIDIEEFKWDLKDNKVNENFHWRVLAALKTLHYATKA